MAIDYNILAPHVVTKIISRIYAPGNVVSRFLGMEIGGPRVTQVTGRAYSWDIFDNVRSIAKFRGPGTGPSTIPANPVGTQNVTFPRSYEKIGDISYEKLANIRVIGENAGSRDRMGMRYLEKQGTYIKTRQNNWREFMNWGMLTGSCGFLISGDDWVPVMTGGNITIDYRIPAGNKTKLNMLGTGDIIDGSWALPATDIPKHVDAISSAFNNLVGAPLAWMMTDSTVFRNMLKCTAIINQGGSANTAFAEYEMTDDRGPDGNRTGLLRARIKAFPWLDIGIYDGVLEVNGNLVKLFDGTKAAFGVDMALNYFQGVEGSEPVKESPWAPPEEQYGMHTWIREWDEPARVELHAIQNYIPELSIPKGLAWGTIVF